MSFLTLNKFNPHAATHRACDVTPEMMRGFHLPRDFPFFSDAVTEEIHRPLIAHFIKIGLGRTFDVNGRWHKSRVTNAAYAIQQWTDLLGQVQLKWEGGSRELFRVFGDGLLSRVNERTGENLSSEYMGRVASYVAEAYETTNALGMTAVDLDAGPVIEMLSDDDLDVAASSDAFGVRTRRRLRRKAMEECEWLKVAEQLGPLRQAGWHDGMPSMLPRLGSETGLQTGTRVSEALLDLETVMRLPWDGDTTGHVALPLLNTKGGKLREVALPKLLLGGYRHYAETERRAATDRLRRRLQAAYVEPGALFVHPLDAGVWAGRPIQAQTLQALFRKAVIAAGLVERVKVRLPNGEHVEFEVARYSYHALRHTFAIWMYYVRKHILKIDSEPWKYISARLGHADLGVTLGVYLDLGRLLEPDIGRLIRGTFLAACDWEQHG
jgi:integrase